MARPTHMSGQQVGDPTHPAGHGKATIRYWFAAWLGCAALAVTNGGLREALFVKRLGQQRAHQLSTGLLTSALGAYVVAVDRRRPLTDRETAVEVGAAWATFTLLFEFGLGRARGMSWSQMLADYNVARGRCWVLVPLTMAVSPAVVESRHRRRQSTFTVPPDSKAH